MDDKMMEKERYITRLHLVYGFIILAILGVFLLLVAPGKVNENAFDNFCFAATIVSIVLAVVSIVYSFRTKNNASDNMAGIREIERGIDDKLCKFDELEKHIIEEFSNLQSRGINPLQKDVSSLHDDQVGIREGLEQLKAAMKQQAVPKGEKDVAKDQNTKESIKGNSFLGNLILYIALQSFKTNKAIKLSEMNSKLFQQRGYMYGYLIALCVFFPNRISIVYDKSKNGLGEIKMFDESFFGDEAVCKRRINGYKDAAEAKECIDAIDSYFSKE